MSYCFLPLKVFYSLQWLVMISVIGEQEILGKSIAREHPYLYEAAY